MKKLLILAPVALALSAHTAAAADMGAPIDYVPPPAAVEAEHDWSGLFIGAFGGGGILTATTTDYQGALLSLVTGDFTVSEAGAFGGVDVGFNVQHGHAVLGIEADIQSGMSASRDLTSSPGAVIGGEWSWLATVRGKAGIAADKVLGYVTAGVAFADAYHEWGVPGVDYQYVDFGDTVVGIAAGAGVEYAFSDHLSAKLEYLYVGFPTESTLGPYYGYDDYDFTSSAHMARAGLNVHF